MARKKQNLVKKEIIKSNGLIESGYKLTISENRLIDLALTKLGVVMLDKNLSAEEVQTLIKQRQFDTIEINVADYKKEFGLKANSLYEDMSETINRLYNRSIVYFEGNDLVTKRWVITCKYNEENCSVALQFHPDLIPDLLVFKGEFTRFDFDIKKYVKSYYTCRIYELLKQYASFGVRYFDIEQLRFLLGIEDDEYPMYSNFKQRILKPSIEQINKVTDIYCEMEEIKNKKKVERIKFRFVIQSVDYKNPEQISFTDEEVAITKTGDNKNIVLEFKELLGVTISPRQIDKIVKIASESIKKYNLNISVKEYIKQKKNVVDEYGKKFTIKSYVGALIVALDSNWTLTEKRSSFNDFEQRIYDFEDLEQRLLGWK